MSTTAALALIDMAMGALEVATRANQLITQARTEGRDVTIEEYEALVKENDAKRAAWNEATKDA